MNKQIEEMYKDVYKAVEHNSVIDITHGGYIGINTDGLTRELFDDGYRKQSEGEWIKPSMYSEDICSKCGKSPKIFFGLLSPFCPNCGAKMKGGE